MDEKQYNRLIQLVNEGKTYHYRNFVFAGLIFVLLLKSPDENLKLFLDIDFSVRYLILFLYLVIIINTIIVLDILKSIWEPIYSCFKEEIPFNWFVLIGASSYKFALLLVVFPWVLSLIGILFSELILDKGILIWIGFFGISLPSYIKSAILRLKNKEDEEKNKITLSIYLLYLYRLLRNLCLFGMFLYTLIEYFKENSDQFKIGLKNPFIIALILLLIIRIIASIKYVYSKIDKWGVKYGFMKEYKKE